MYRGAWWATVRGVTKSRARLCTHIRPARSAQQEAVRHQALLLGRQDFALQEQVFTRRREGARAGSGQEPEDGSALRPVRCLHLWSQPPCHPSTHTKLWIRAKT